LSAEKKRKNRAKSSRQNSQPLVFLLLWLWSFTYSDFVRTLSAAVKHASCSRIPPKEQKGKKKKKKKKEEGERGRLPSMPNSAALF
jgi:hypothetical protein